MEPLALSDQAIGGPLPPGPVLRPARGADDIAAARALILDYQASLGIDLDGRALAPYRENPEAGARYLSVEF